MRAPEPVAAPSISSGPMFRGPWARQPKANFTAPAGPTSPAEVSAPAAPSKVELVIASTPFL